MFRLNNLQKIIAVLILLIFVVEIVAAPVSVQAQASSQQSSGSTAVFATIGALAAGVLAYCIAVSAGTIQGFGFGLSSPPFQCTIENPPGVHLLSSDGLKKWIFDPAARIIIRALLQATTQQVVSWIQGNSGKNVGYVANLEQALRREADAAGGEFLNNITGINLCGNIGAFINISLRTPGLRQRLECTVTDIVRNVNSFYRNFSQGGWPALIRISFEPQNNPAGAYLIALDAKLEAENRARQRITEGFRVGGRFLGFSVPVKRNCFTPAQKEAQRQAVSVQAQPINEFVRSLGNLQFASPLLNQAQPNRDFEIDDTQKIEAQIQEQKQRAEREEIRATEEAQIREFERLTEEAEQREFERTLGGSEKEAIRTIQEPICDIEYETRTPGRLIADGLSKVTFGGIDFAFAAKEFDEAISVIINALIQKLISTAFVGSSSETSGQGIFDPGFRNLPREDLTDSVIAKRINDGLFMADAGLALVDAKLISERRTLIDARKKLDDLTVSNPSSSEIPQLKQQIAGLQTSIAASLEIKRSILFSQLDLLFMEQSLARSPTPSEIQRVAQGLPSILQRLGNTVSALGALPSTALSAGSRKQDLLEKLRGTKANLTNARTMVDDTGNEVERQLAGNTDGAKKQQLTLHRSALLTQRALLQSQLDSVLNLEKEILGTGNEDRIRDRAAIFSRQLLTVNQILDQTGDILTKTDQTLK